MLQNYQLSNAKDIFMGAIQTETAYMQSAPNALNGGFTPDPAFADPDFADCTTDTCKKTWGLRVTDSENIYMYGGGLYSFFEDYSQDCLATNDCQLNMIDLRCSSNVNLLGLTTKATVNMVLVNGEVAVKGADHVNGFGNTVAIFSQQGA
jgi:glucan 1,3-beta-glucosidase